MSLSAAAQRLNHKEMWANFACRNAKTQNLRLRISKLENFKHTKLSVFMCLGIEKAYGWS